MNLPDFFNVFLPFFYSFLCAYLGDFLFSIPNGLKLLSNSSKNPLKIIVNPWFSFTIPTFIGIILSGVIVKNYTPFLIENIDDDIVNIIRIISTITIIYRIALSLDLSVLKQHKITIFLLGIFPNITEAFFVAFFAEKIFVIKREFSFCLGFEVSGASTAILMPILLAFKEENISNLSSILLAASVLDNILSIFNFNFARTLAFANGDFSNVFIRRSEGLCLGTFVGICFGRGFKEINKRRKPRFYFIFTYFISIFMVFLLDYHDFRGAGFIFIWISMLISSDNQIKIDSFSNKTWSFLRLFLFFFIGISIDLKDFSQNIVKNSLILIVLSSIFRIFSTFLCLFFFEKFTKKEILFASMSWFAKASLQAALGSAMLYESFSKHYNSEIISQSLIISQISICYILFTGPVGGILISKYGKILLEVKRKRNFREEDEKIALVLE